MEHQMAMTEDLEQAVRIRRFQEQELALRRERQERAEGNVAQALVLRRRFDQDRKAIREPLAAEVPTDVRVSVVPHQRKQGQEGQTLSGTPAKAVCKPDVAAGSQSGAAVGRDHPYRLFFNWPALREDHITGRAE